jgi:hypothetical protein
MATLAPAPEIVRYLAIFHRMFDPTARYGREGNRADIVLTGWMADALHNVPGLLLRYDRASPAWWTAEAMDQWMYHFPETLRDAATPDPLADECAHIFTAAELPVGFVDVADPYGDIAPEQKLREYADFLYYACLTLRGFRSWGADRPRPWRTMTDAPGAEQWMAFVARYAAALLPIPGGLTRWSRFDENRFFADALAIGDDLPEERREHWRQHFTFRRDKIFGVSQGQDQ